jgi:hypothetical protein
LLFIFCKTGARRCLLTPINNRRQSKPGRTLA